MFEIENLMKLVKEFPKNVPNACRRERPQSSQQWENKIFILFGSLVSFQSIWIFGWLIKIQLVSTCNKIQRWKDDRTFIYKFGEKTFHALNVAKLFVVSDKFRIFDD